MYQSGNIQEELGEALSRASVLQSLDTAYATSTPKKTAKIGTTSATKTKGPNSGNKTPRNGRGQPNANEDVVAMLQVLVDDNSNKTGKFFMEQIKGKSIILENVRTQTAATKFSEQEKRFELFIWLFNSIITIIDMFSSCISQTNEATVEDF